MWITLTFPTLLFFFRWNWPQDELRQQVGGLEISQKCIVTLHSNHGCTHQELCCHTKQTRFAPYYLTENFKFTLCFAYHISMNLVCKYLAYSCQALKQTDAFFSCNYKNCKLVDALYKEMGLPLSFGKFEKVIIYFVFCWFTIRIW